MLISPDYVKGETLVNYNVSDSVIGHAIRDAQRNYLPEVMPQALVDNLQHLVSAKVAGEAVNLSTEGNELWATLLEDYVQPYLAAKTQAILCWQMAQRLRNAGVVQNTDTNLTPVSATEMRAAMRDFEAAACAAATRLSHYVEEHASAFGLECFNGRIWVNSGVFLGRSRRGGRCCNG